MSELCIVIPCYNEMKNIPLILDRFSKVIKDSSIELLLVNNGSTDDSQSVLDQLLPKYGFAKTLLVPVNQGYGYGILQGLKSTKSKYIGWTHADMQTDPADLIKAFNLLGENTYVKGNRKKRPIFDQIFTLGMSLFESIYLKSTLWDINAQPTIFPRTFFQRWENPPWDFSLDLYAYYKAKKLGLVIRRFDVLFPKRIHGSSSWNTGLKSKIKFIKRTLEFSHKLKQGGIH